MNLKTYETIGIVEKSPKYSKNNQSAFHWLPHDESKQFKSHAEGVRKMALEGESQHFRGLANSMLAQSPKDK
jgi:hypothetical protein